MPTDSAAVRDLIDRAEIEALIKLYFTAVDRKRIDRWDEVFAPDGRLWMGGQLVRGEGISGMALPLDAIQVPGTPVGATHALHQSAIDLEGDTAKGETYAVSYLVLADPQRVLVRGLRYLDRFVRLPIGWRLQERWHNLDWMYECPAIHAVPYVDRMKLEELA
ncbi:MAG: nuclear transport factor 2 family protein [Sphingobium sp.]